MDILWSPWRYRYVTKENPTNGCVFCRISGNPEADKANLVLRRFSEVYVVLNRYPYTTAHLMVVPYVHVPSLRELSPACLSQMMHVAREAEIQLSEEYRPGGFNMGLNLGECAGAGIAGHIHLHVLPRWSGDASFMTTIGETRVLPEELGDTWRRLAPRFATVQLP